MSGSDPQKRPESKYRRSSDPPGPVEWSRHQGIVMMMSKLKLGKKEKYVRVGLGMYLTGSCSKMKNSPRPGIEPGTL